jgi:hypothetical protein
LSRARHQLPWPNLSRFRPNPKAKLKFSLKSSGGKRFGASRRPEISVEPAAEIAPAACTRLDPLSPELTVLRQAQEDLRAGLPAQALRRLADYDRRFGKGAPQEERRAVAAIALCCRVNPGPAAEIEAARFLQTAPESPLAELRSLRMPEIRRDREIATTKFASGREPYGAQQGDGP